MSTATHTPGPWTFDRDWHRLPTIFAADGKTKIAIVEKVGRDEFTPAQEANARLIAAAPDLLAACRDILNDQDVGCSHKGHHNCSFDAVRAAIAKAEGKQ